MELSAICVPLLAWFAGNRRELPWRCDREPYHVWVSEIMLQQTRVEVVRAYYLRFMRQLPTLCDLAQADDELLLKLWEGLGYYSRARNLKKAARQLIEAGGVFPQNCEALRALPGIGAYTAGAIASICFEQPTPAVDGNVLRVLTRLLACDKPITDERTKTEIRERLAAVYPHGHCGDFTQALMELGATVCVPNGAPRCEQCPLAKLCLANQSGMQTEYPVKAKKKPRRIEERTVLILRCGERLAVCKRPAKGLLAGLWQLPDVPGTLSAQQAADLLTQWELHPIGVEKTVQRTHIFTHVQWNLTGIYLQCDAQRRFSWYTEAELAEKIGLPTAYRQFLEK